MRAIGKGFLAIVLALLGARPGWSQLATPSVVAGSQIPSAVSGTVSTQSASGWTINVDSTWLDGPGYRPLRVTVTPAINVTGDRDLLIRVTAHPYYGTDDPMITTEQFLSVPSGTPAGQAIGTSVSVPPSNLGCDLSVEIIDPATVKGTVFKQQQIRGLGTRMGMNGIDVVMSKYPHIIFVGKTLPDTSAITAILPPLEAYSNNPVNYPTAGEETADQDAKKSVPAIPLPSALAVPTADLPVRWIDYSSLDIVCLSIDQLGELAKTRPAAYRAILDWTRAGGNLWICGVSGGDGPWERLPELEQLVGMPSAGDAKNDKNDTAGWSEPSAHAEEIEQMMNPQPANPQPYPYYGPRTRAYRPPVVKTPPVVNTPVTSLPEVRLRAHGMGTVAAIASANPFAGDKKWSSSNWAVLLSSIGAGRWQWNYRHGINLGQLNNDFWNFLIPGVGLAPVRTFQVFITLFVLGIGPVNYWLLRRRKRLHLMVLTVPLSAAVVTGMLFGYGLLADGLGTRVRVRSVTRLDSRGEAVTWARLSYYAGIAPSKGLTFSPQTAVYPIFDKPEMDYYSATRKKLEWDRDQGLVQGWLDARTPTQYLTIRSGPSSCRLNIAKASAGDAAPTTIENRLGTPIERIVIAGRDGKFYAAEDVADGAKTQAQETTAEMVNTWLNTAINDHHLEFPLGADPRDLSMSMLGGRRYYWYPFGNADPVEMTSSRLERTLERLLPGNGGSHAFGDDQPLLKPGSYIALVPHLPEVEFGAETAREEASFHVIVGEW